MRIKTENLWLRYPSNKNIKYEVYLGGLCWAMALQMIFLDMSLPFSASTVQGERGEQLFWFYS